jgi:hypothetical protein
MLINDETTPSVDLSLLAEALNGLPKVRAGLTDISGFLWVETDASNYTWTGDIEHPNLFMFFLERMRRLGYLYYRMGQNPDNNWFFQASEERDFKGLIRTSVCKNLTAAAASVLTRAANPAIVYPAAGLLSKGGRDE